MQAHAGTVMGGWVLRRRPQVPPAIRDASVGNSRRNSWNTSWGAAQSSPITATLMGSSPSTGSRPRRAGLDRLAASPPATPEPAGDEPDDIEGLPPRAAALPGP